MHNKHIQFLLLDRQFRPRLIACVILLVVAITLSGIVKANEKSLRRAQSQYRVVLETSQMELVLNPAPVKKKESTARTKALREEDVLVFRGMAVMSSWYHAIINDDVFALDEIYGDYKVINITDDSVELLHMESKKVRKLILPEFVH